MFLSLIAAVVMLRGNSSETKTTKLILTTTLRAIYDGRFSKAIDFVIAKSMLYTHGLGPFVMRYFNGIFTLLP